MNITRLEYLESVYRLRSFTKAAVEQHVSQPSISNAVAAIEEIIEGNKADTGRVIPAHAIDCRYLGVSGHIRVIAPACNMLASIKKRTGKSAFPCPLKRQWFSVSLALFALCQQPVDMRFICAEGYPAEMGVRIQIS